MDINESPAPASGGQLSSPFKLISSAWPLYKNKLTTFILLSLLGTAAFLAALLVPIGMIFVGSLALPVLKGPLTAILIVLAFFLAFYTICRFQLAFVTAVVTEPCGVKEAIAASRRGVRSFFWLGLLKTFLIIGGCLLFFVPGVLFSIWFCLWPFVFVSHGLKGLDCLLASRALIRGKGWGVFGRLLIAWVATAVITAIPFVGPILAVLLIPFNMIYVHLMYQELSAGRPSAPSGAPAGSKISVVLVGALGFVVIPVLTLLLFFTLLKGMATASGMDPARFFQGNKPAASAQTASAPKPAPTPPPPPPPAVRVTPATSVGFASPEDLLAALKDAVKNHDLKKFLSCFAPVGLDADMESDLVGVAQHIFKQNVTRVWVPEPGTLAFNNMKKIYGAYASNIPYDGSFRFNFDNDTNKAVNFLYGRHNGKYYLAHTAAYARYRAEKKPVESGGFMANAVKQATEKIQAVHPAARSSAMTHQLKLKNGQTLDCAIVSRDSRGMWVETGPGIRSYWTHAEVVDVTELEKPAAVTDSASPSPAPAAAAPRPLPVAEAPEAPTPGYEGHLAFARKVIEEMDRTGWDYRTLGKYRCGGGEDWKPMDSMIETYQTLGRAGGIETYLKVEQKMCEVAFGDKTCWVNFKLMFRAAYPNGAPGSRQAVNIGLNVIENKDGSYCVNGTSLNPYST